MQARSGLLLRLQLLHAFRSLSQDIGTHPSLGCLVVAHCASSRRLLIHVVAPIKQLQQLSWLALKIEVALSCMPIELGWHVTLVNSIGLPVLRLDLVDGPVQLFYKPGPMQIDLHISQLFLLLLPKSLLFGLVLVLNLRQVIRHF